MKATSKFKTAESRIKLIIVDDHPLFRAGLKQMIAVESRFLLLEEAGDGFTALSQLCTLKPDIAIVDVNLPGMGGLELMRQLRLHRLECKIIVLTMFKDEAIFNQAMNLGAHGYMLKESAGTDILTCLHAVAKNEYYISPSLSGCVARRHARTIALEEGKPDLAKLTTAERRILKLIAENRTSKEIAAELFISLRTVETHRTNICHKLALEGNQPLLRFALEHHADMQL